MKYQSDCSILAIAACVAFSIATMIQSFCMMQSVSTMRDYERRIHFLELAEDWQNHRTNRSFEDRITDWEVRQSVLARRLDDLDCP